MGLDQYAHVRINKWNPHFYSFEWRKHSRLQQFMMELWHNKGFNEEFNCKELELDADDITADGCTKIHVGLLRQVNRGLGDFGDILIFSVDQNRSTSPNGIDVASIALIDISNSGSA